MLCTYRVYSYEFLILQPDKKRIVAKAVVCPAYRVP